jgi:4-amino-4-deoxy-L-arabinose transferase-like glycosyltransferase
MPQVHVLHIESTALTELFRWWLSHVEPVVLPIAFLCTAAIIVSQAAAFRKFGGYDRNDAWWAVGIVLASTAARFALLPRANLIVIDEWENIAAAMELVRTGTYAYPRQDLAGEPRDLVRLEYLPLLHVLTAALTRLGLAARDAAALINCLVSSAIAVPAYVAVRALRPDLPKARAVGATVLFATLPVFVTLSRSASTDPLLTLSLLCALTSILAWRCRDTDRTRHLWGAGAALVLAGYARAEAPYLIAIVLVALAVTRPWLPHTGTLQRLPWRAIAAVSAVGVALLVPALFHGWIGNIMGKGDASLTQRLTFGAAGVVGAHLIWILAPHAFPPWLALAAARGIGTLRSATPRWLAFWWLVLCGLAVVYAQDAASFGEDLLSGPLLHRKEYHLGPFYVLAGAAALAWIPTGLWPHARRWLAVGLVLNALSTAGLYAMYLSGDKQQAGLALAEIASELPDDAILLNALEGSVTALTNLEFTNVHFVARLSSPDYVDRPAFLFCPFAPDTGQTYVWSVIEQAGYAAAPTRWPALWRLTPKERRPSSSPPNPSAPHE